MDLEVWVGLLPVKLVGTARPLTVLVTARRRRLVQENEEEILWKYIGQREFQ